MTKTLCKNQFIIFCFLKDIQSVSFLCSNYSSLVINVKDKEHIGASFIASVTISAEDLLAEETIDGKIYTIYNLLH